jgi:restriction endonuclease S subunit
MWKYTSYSSRNYQSNSTVVPVKPTTFQITLYSANGKKINTWTGRAIRHEDGVCKFYDEKTGTLVQIIGTVVIE